MRRLNYARAHDPAGNPGATNAATNARAGDQIFRRAGARLVAGVAAGLLIFAMPGDAYQTPLDTKSVHDAYVLGQRNDQSTGDFLAPYIKEMTESLSATRVAEIELLTPYAQVVDDSRKNTAGYTEGQAMQQYQQAGNTVEVNVTLLLPSAYPKANGASSATPPGTPPVTTSASSSPTTVPYGAAAAAAADTATGQAQSATDRAPSTTGQSPSPSDQMPNGNAQPPAATTQAPSATGQPPSAARPGDAAKPSTQTQGNGNLRPENFWQSFQFYCKQNGKKIPSKSMHDKPIYSTATKDTPAVLDGASVWIEFDAKDVASQETVIEVVTPDGKTISATFDLKKLR
jgi:hypothetical protein